MAAVVPALALMSMMLSATAAAAPTRLAAPASTSCAWPSLITIQTNNVLFPDANAEYGVQPIVGAAGTEIIVSGSYANARYMSLSVYTPYGQPFVQDGISSSLPDFEIAPISGSKNPWQQAALPGGRFAVTITTKARKGEKNVLPLPAGTTALHPGFLMYRVYLPAGGNFRAVSLPTISIERGGKTQTLAPCRTHTARVTPEAVPSSQLPPDAEDTNPPPPEEFFKPYQAELFANADTPYIETYAPSPPAGDVIVVTGKAPTFPTGAHPSPWPKNGVDVQYWSLCVATLGGLDSTVANKLAGGQTDYGCRDDQQTNLGASGAYTFVIGTESERPAIAKVAGATFVPLSSGPPPRYYLLVWRDVLVSPDFLHTAQGVTRLWSPSALAAAMGAYYPRAATCALSTVTNKGPEACFSPSDE
jgi:hypothetical protein